MIEKENLQNTQDEAEEAEIDDKDEQSWKGGNFKDKTGNTNCPPFLGADIR